MQEGTLIRSTLANAFGAMWDMFWPLLVPGLVLIGVAALVVLYRSFTRMG